MVSGASSTDTTGQKWPPMIDTIRLNLHGKWADSPPSGSEWERTESHRTQCKGPDIVETSGVTWHNHENGLRIMGHELGPLSAEVSLPRLLHGCNSRLIEDQDQMDASLGMLQRDIGSFAEVAQAECFDVSRVDVVWNVRIQGGIDVVINQLRNVRHPEVRKATTVYDRESIHFPGKMQHLRLYDKRFEKERRRSDIVRCELQLRGRHVDRVFERDAPYMGGMGSRSLDGLKAYRYLSGFCSQLGTMKIPRVSHPVDFICYLYHEGIRDSRGVLVVEEWLASLPDRSRRRYQRRFRDYKHEVRKVEWADILPPLLPPPVDLREYQAA